MTDDDFTQLRDLLASIKAVPTFDRRRSISLSCWLCDTIAAPRDLVEVGRYTRHVGGNLGPGDAIVRPMCADCVKATAPATEGNDSDSASPSDAADRLNA